MTRVWRQHSGWITLGIVLAAGLSLRLWRIHSLFATFHDYDPGAYVLGARFISQGLVPYRDFVLVHPPLYDFVLAGIYRLFGYDFFYGRYLSVALSAVCILLVFFLGRRLYGRRAGLVAAALFAVEPMMVYFGRRIVQESLGITLVLSAVALVLLYVEKHRHWLLFVSGLFLGLAISAKYVFVPVSAGVLIALAFVEMPASLRGSIARLGNAAFWAAYICVAGLSYAFLFLIRMVFGVPVSIPMIEPLFLNAPDTSVFLLVFVVPLYPASRLAGLSLPLAGWAAALLSWCRTRAFWLMVAGIGVGFFAVTGYFWVALPGEFITQTVVWQGERPAAELPSLLALARMAPLLPSFFRMSCLSVLFVVPLVLILMHRHTFRTADCFIVVLLAVTVLMSQVFFQLPRYYASIFPFMLIGVASLIPSVNRCTAVVWQRVGAILVTALFVLAVCLSMALLVNYSGYDVFVPRIGTGERVSYETTAAYLREIGAKRVYATNPIYAAMAPGTESSRQFDTFALVWLERRSPEEIVNTLRSEGVDYILVDQWARCWGPPYKEGIDHFVAAIRRHAALVNLIDPESPLMVEVYRLDGATDLLSNGEFEYWSDCNGRAVPLGWNPVLISSDSDVVGLERSSLGGTGGVELSVYEDGEAAPGFQATHAGLSQRTKFPEEDILLTVRLDVATESVGVRPLGLSVHFIDGRGHSVTIGFSDAIQEEVVTRAREGTQVVVMRPAPLHRWSSHAISLRQYWLAEEWGVPADVQMLIVLSAHSDYPGYYTCGIASAILRQQGDVPQR